MKLEPFATSRALTLGVELELQIVNRMTGDLQPAAEELLRRFGDRRLPGDIKPEVTQSMIELATGICRGYEHVRGELRSIRDALVDSARQAGVRLAGGGTHPFQDWTERRIFDAPRFRQVSDLYGYLAKQFTVFGQHVHVGCAGPDQALALLHGMSRFVPHLIALAASSPYVRGVDTGFHSARLNSVFAFPLSGWAPFVLHWEDFETYFEKMTRTGVVRGMKDFYWDIRPKPEFGTIEVRVLDTPLTVEKAAALAGLIQCLAHWLQHERPFVPRADDYLAYTFNRFQACRFGLEGTYVEPGSGEHKVLREEVARLLKVLEPHADALHCRGALLFFAQELKGFGNDATALRAAFAHRADMPALVRDQADRWATSETPAALAAA